VWAPVGNGAVLAFLLLRASQSRAELTGRQSNLPPVSVKGGMTK
jgi:hypothetical protein